MLRTTALFAAARRPPLRRKVTFKVSASILQARCQDATGRRSCPDVALPTRTRGRGRKPFARQSSSARCRPGSPTRPWEFLQRPPPPAGRDRPDRGLGRSALRRAIRTPRPLTFTAGWVMGKPDAVIEM